MWVAIVFLVLLVPLGVIAVISFLTGQTTAKELFSEVGKLSPIPKVSEFNFALVVLGAGGILAGVAAVLAAQKGSPVVPPSKTSFSVSNPQLGTISVNPLPPPPPVAPPRRGP